MTPDELELLAEAATAGEWKAAPFSSVVGCPITTQPDPKKNTVVVAGVHGAFGENYKGEVEVNAALIVALRNHAPAIVAMWRALEEWISYIDALDEQDDGLREDRLLAQMRNAAADMRR